jgi:hypothetical protein
MAAFPPDSLEAVLLTALRATGRAVPDTFVSHNPAIFGHPLSLVLTIVLDPSCVSVLSALLNAIFRLLLLSPTPQCD